MKNLLPSISYPAFDLALFHTTLQIDGLAVAASIHTIVVDWEYRGKEERQRHYDTQINRHTVEDLRMVRTIPAVRIICRLNSFSAATQSEVETAIANGTDEILLPMVRRIEEVETVLAYTAGRCGVGIMIETTQAVELAETFSRYPLSRAYVGLNDLSIARQDRHLFMPLANGTIERVRHSMGHIPFGFAGLTVPDRGEPLPCRLLIAETARLNCAFTFLRRSFIRDIQGQDVAAGIASILESVAQAQSRPPQQIEAEHIEAVKMIHLLPDRPWKSTGIE